MAIRHFVAWCPTASLTLYSNLSHHSLTADNLVLFLRKWKQSGERFSQVPIAHYLYQHKYPAACLPVHLHEIPALLEKASLSTVYYGPLSYSGNLLQQFSLSCDTNSPSPLDVLIGIHAGCFNFHLKSPLDPTSLFQPMLHFSPCLQCTCAYSSTDALPPSFCHPSSTKTVLVKAINDLHVAESSNHLLISDLLINSIQNCWLLLDHITSLLRTCSWFSSSHNGHLVCLLCWPSLRPTLLTSLYLQHSSLYLLSVLSAFMCLGISCNLSHSP